MEKTVKKVTPLMKQYNAIKVKHPDAILLFRVGDFYETFGEDAIKTSKILDIILTKRGAGSQSETELAGFPHHSLNSYLPKLVKAGNRVAICDQLENPKLTKTIVKRGVTELVTPGLATIDGVLNPKTNNFLASVYLGNNIGVSFLDISTGEFLIAEGSIDYVEKLLENFDPSEILISKQKKLNFLSKFNNNFQLFFLEDWVYQYDFAIESLCNHFKTKSLKGFGVEKLKDGLVSAGAIMHYLSETQHQKINHITSINRIPKDDYIWMDGFTIKNLEIFHSFSREGKSLIDVIDKTISPMGGRLLKRWVALPSKNIKLIRNRHLTVKYLIDNETALSSIQENIKEIGDLERLISKVATGKINPREVIQLKNSLAAIEPIKKLLKKSKAKSLKELSNSLDNCNQLRKLIEKTLISTCLWLEENLGYNPDEWQWGKIHTTSFQHGLTLGQELLSIIFNIGPFPIGGDTDTVCQTAYNPGTPYAATEWSPAIRLIIDLNNFDESKFILPPGQSGILGSKHYDDMVDPWLNGEYIPLVWTENKVQEVKKYELIFRALND